MHKNENHVREPLFHIVKRAALPGWQSAAIRVLAVLISLIVCGIIIVLFTGENPINVYATMIKGAVGTNRRLWNLLQSVAILLCISLAVTPAFRMRFWNTGAEGQALIGGLATAACMIFFGGKMPTALLLIVTVVASVVAGAVWGLIPALFKAYWGTNETLFTLMMNYVAIQIVSFFTYRFSVPKGSGQIGIINRDTRAGWLPVIGNNYLLNILIVVVLTILIYIYLNYSKHGYEISVVGQSENTARYIGIDVKKVITRTMLISGAICGLAGLLLVAGTDHTITRDTIAGRGFTAIMVSWMAKFNPIYMIITSFLICFMSKGSVEIATVFGFNDSFADIITGIIIFFIIGSEFFINYQIKRTHREGGKA